MLDMAAVAEPLIITFIGEKWRSSVILLQMLCFVGMMYPLQSLNLNMLQVAGRSDLFLRLEIIKKTLSVPVIIIGIYLGIVPMIIGMIINSFIAYIINSFWSGKFVGYSTKEQISDILPSFLFAAIMSVGVYLLGHILPFAPLIILIVQVLSGAIFVLIAGELFKHKDYLYIKSIILEQINNVKLRNAK
jgi:O-antigen/teichoic acid export membrane protein